MTDSDRDPILKNIRDAIRFQGFKKAVTRFDSRQSCRRRDSERSVADQRVPLEQTEQFEHDHDNDDDSNYIKYVSIHAAINTRSRPAWSTVDQTYERSSYIYFEQTNGGRCPSAVLNKLLIF